jgi:hypothetical protein
MVLSLRCLIHYVNSQQEVVTNSAVPAKAVDARDLKEKRMRTKTEKTSSRDNLLKYGDVADGDSSDEEG